MILITKLFVGSLPWAVDDARLNDLFAPFGEVVSATVLRDRMTGRSRGFGFVEMADDSAAQKAIDALNGSDIEGRKIVVNVARPREDRPGEERHGRREEREERYEAPTEEGPVEEQSSDQGTSPADEAR